MADVERARRMLVDAGFERLAREINATARPCRPLEGDEALAMLRYWKRLSEGLPVCVCDDSTVECPYYDEDAEDICRPDWDDERVVAERLRSLARPIGAHGHVRGETCTWPDTFRRSGLLGW